MKFYRCNHCGNIVTFLHSSGVPVVCCGEKMTELIPGTVDASVEKHIPVMTEENGVLNVKVGAVEHPMIPEHFIEWVALETKQGSQIKYLKAGEKPEVSFTLAGGDEIVSVYAYCNIHGLWKL